MKNLLIAAFLSLLFLVGVVVLAGAAEVTALQAQDNGREIRVQAGAIIELSLETQGGTGYTWEFDCLDEEHFELLKTETKLLGDQRLVGGPVLMTWRLKTKKPGESRLALDYFRPWEPRSTAIKHFQVQVRIH